MGRRSATRAVVAAAKAVATLLRVALARVATPVRDRLSRLFAPAHRLFAGWGRAAWSVRGVRLSVRISAVLLTGLIGGGIGMTLGGKVETAVGPADVSMSVRPSWSGQSIVDIPPLGTLELDSHDGPIQLLARVEGIRPEPAQEILDDPNKIELYTSEIASEVQHGVTRLVVRSVLISLGCSLLAGLIVFRNWRKALWAGLSGLGGLAFAVVVAISTFNPQSVAEPRFTGVLANAPQLVGDTHTVVRRFEEYRVMLARMVGNVSRLYATTSTLPGYEPDPSTLRILHVSDIHLHPGAWDVIKSVTKQFQIQAIVDSGDLTDNGSSAENSFVSAIGKLGVPYVYVRGSNDTRATERAVAKEKNAVVLDGTMKEVLGLRFYGLGAPVTAPDGDQKAWLKSEGQRVAQTVQATPPDVAVVHDPRMGEGFDGVTPLVLSGQTHQRSTRLLPTGTRLFVQGSTGSAGLSGLEKEKRTPIELSVLYFSRASHRLQAWDDIRLGGLGLASATIERTLEKNPNRDIEPPSPPPGTPSPGAPGTLSPPARTTVPSPRTGS